MEFCNVYQDECRAASYGELEYPGTYYLAFRDIPKLIAGSGLIEEGARALDFGCGAGRSTRFLRSMGYVAVGVDISPQMLKQARIRDPEGEYRLVADGDLSMVEEEGCDLLLSAFTFDNIPTRQHKLRILRELHRLVRPGGVLVNLVSSPDIYLHEWASFTTRQFPQNRNARDGDPVYIVMTDVEDRRPVTDIRCSDGLYRRLFAEAGFRFLQRHRPLGYGDEPFAWKAETEIAPWSIYLLQRPY